MKSEITASQLARLKQDCESIARESLKVESISRTFYAYGTELACLRLLHRYRDCRGAAASYSENLNTWYFRLEKFYD